VTPLFLSNRSRSSLNLVSESHCGTPILKEIYALSAVLSSDKTEDLTASGFLISRQPAKRISSEKIIADLFMILIFVEFTYLHLSISL
jgi:hypothetical protein